MSQPQHEAAYLIEKYGFTEAIARTEKALAGLSGPGRDETAEWHTRAILAYLEGYKAAKKPDCLAAVK
jgi:cytochrome c1